MTFIKCCNNGTYSPISFVLIDIGPTLGPVSLSQGLQRSHVNSNALPQTRWPTHHLTNTYTYKSKRVSVTSKLESTHPLPPKKVQFSHSQMFSNVPFIFKWANSQRFMNTHVSARCRFHLRIEGSHIVLKFNLTERV